jgi:hypothetical protein
MLDIELELPQPLSLLPKARNKYQNFGIRHKVYDTEYVNVLVKPTVGE